MQQSSTVDLPGAAHLVLAADVAYLEPETAFTAMVDGWALQQRTRFLKPATISSRLTLVRRVAAFTNEYPWRWQAADVEGFIDGCRNQAQPLDVGVGELIEVSRVNEQVAKTAGERSTAAPVVRRTTVRRPRGR